MNLSPFESWVFCLAGALMMLALVLMHGDGYALLYGTLLYTNSLLLFNKRNDNES